MNRRLGIGALILIPVLAVMFHLLGRSGLRPLTGYLVGLMAYWALLALALRLTGDGWSLRPRAPHAPALLALLALVGAAAWAWGSTITALSPHVLLGVAVAASINGTLEEGFWRGALIPKAGPLAQLGACLLFLLWHLAPAAGAVLSGQDQLRPLLGATLIAPFMMAARLSSGTAGAGALAHAMVNFFAFAALAAGHGRSV
jgi:hypothetical protein